LGSEEASHVEMGDYPLQQLFDWEDSACSARHSLKQLLVKIADVGSEATHEV